MLKFPGDQFILSFKRTFSESTLHNVMACSGKYHWVYSSQDESLLLRNIIMDIHARAERLN